MTSIPQREIGSTGTYVTEFGLGTAPLGDLFVALSEESAQGVLQAGWDVGVRYYDTSPFYGNGKSEHRVGHFLRQQPRNEFVLSTKVGRVFKAARDPNSYESDDFVGALPFDFTVDYSYDGIMRSYEDSLHRLGLPSIDLLVIHDLDFYFYKTEARVNAYLTQLFTSGWRALDELRRHGLVKGVGAGINELGMIPRFLDLVELDFFLVAYGYNLLTQAMLAEEFPLCAQTRHQRHHRRSLCIGDSGHRRGTRRPLLLRACPPGVDGQDRPHRADLPALSDAAALRCAPVLAGQSPSGGHYSRRAGNGPRADQLRPAPAADSGGTVEFFEVRGASAGGCAHSLSAYGTTESSCTEALLTQSSTALG